MARQSGHGAPRRPLFSSLPGAASRAAAMAVSCVAALTFATAALSADKVRSGVTLATSDLALFFARDRGYFAAENLDVEVVHFGAGPQMVAPLATGDLDVGGGTASAAFYNAAERKIDIRIVSNRSAMAPGYRYQTIVVRKDHVDSGRFKDYPDFKGMKIALPAAGIGSVAVVDAMARRGGLRYSDIEQVYLAFAQIVAGMAGKAIDGALMVEPYGSMVQGLGTGVVFDTTQAVFPDEEISFVFFGDKFARERPDVARRYMKAVLRGARDYNDAITDGRWNGSKAAKDVERLMGAAMGATPEQLRASFPHFAHPDGAINLEPMRKVLDFFKAQGLVTSKTVSVEQVIDMSFVNAAVKELGPYRRAAP